MMRASRVEAVAARILVDRSPGVKGLGGKKLRLSATVCGVASRSNRKPATKPQHSPWFDA